MTINDLSEGLKKSPLAFRTISEASDEVGVPPHVLRFWEGKFSNLRPLKRAGGRRLYRPQDIALLFGFKKLLQVDGLTIKGVQKLIKERGIQTVRDIGMDGSIDFFEADECVNDDVLENSETSNNHHAWEKLAQSVDSVSSDSLKPNPASGTILRRALARLEQARMILDNNVTSGE